MLTPIFRFVRATVRSDVEAFVFKHPSPVLVVEPFAGKSESSSFETLAPGAGGGNVGKSVAEVKKREGANHFGMMVTIGRATNNDVQIPNAQVSKFHAYVMFTGDQAHMTDAGSTHGTHVDGVRLEPKLTKAPLVDGTTIRLGPVKLTYYTPRAFYEYLKAIDI